MQKETQNMSGYEIANIFHRVAMSVPVSPERRDYGTGEKYTGMEVHLVSYIADYPNCTVTEIAKDWRKTKGAVSQLVQKLRKADLIEGIVDKNNPRRIQLRLTKKGENLDILHRKKDQEYWDKMINYLKEIYTEEQLNTTFSVLKTWVENCSEGEVKSKKI